MSIRSQTHSIIFLWINFSRNKFNKSLKHSSASAKEKTFPNSFWSNFANFPTSLALSIPFCLVHKSILLLLKCTFIYDVVLVKLGILSAWQIDNSLSCVFFFSARCSDYLAIKHINRESNTWNIYEYILFITTRCVLFVSLFLLLFVFSPLGF